MKLFKWTRIFFGGMLCLAAAGAGAQAYPTRAVRIVVPYAPGGSADVLARQIGAGLQKLWGQGVVVDNRPGASGNIGSMEVVRAAADGYTLLLQNPTMVANMAVVGRAAYDPAKDLTPILLLGDTPLVLVASASSGIRRLPDLVQKAKADPSALSYGSCGIGSPQHFTMEMVKQKAGIEATHVAYKGCAPALTDVLGGQIPVAALTANLVVPYANDGRLHVLGVSSAQRYAPLGDTPSFDEQGMKPFDLTNWNGLMGPANMPAAVVSKIGADVAKVLADPAVVANLSKAGVDPNPRPAKALTALIVQDLLRYTELVKVANIKPE
jgi:tripartite-type tricarboxylate transporter receptor subunit TctC